MPYIGNTSPSRFVSNRAASVYSGDGSTTAFTLEQAVVQDEDILVSVDGVVQEPSVAYAVSNATTLTFTAAPSSNAGNNIFVYYLASQVGTVGHPSNQALSATNGTFTGDVTIGDASAADKKILFDGNAQDFHIGLDDSADSLTIGLGSALGTTPHMIFDANGHITKPLQPAFLAKPSTQQDNINGNGSDVDVAFGSEIFDNNADFASSTFTAPVTGRYFFTVSLRFENVDTASAYVQIYLKTSNRIIKSIQSTNVFSGDIPYLHVHMTSLSDMDANDTCKIQLQLEGSGASQADVDPESFFSGHLVC